MFGKQSNLKTCSVSNLIIFTLQHYWLWCAEQCAANKNHCAETMFLIVFERCRVGSFWMVFGAVFGLSCVLCCCTLFLVVHIFYCFEVVSKVQLSALAFVFKATLAMEIHTRTHTHTHAHTRTHTHANEHTVKISPHMTH